MGIGVGIPIVKLGRGASKGRTANIGKVIREAWLSEAKDGSLYRCSAHYDKSRLDQNEFTGYQMADDLIEAIEARADEYAAEYKERTGRAMRSDAVIGYAAIVKPPAEWMNGLTPKQREKFWRDSDAVIGNILGDTVMATTTQRDEQGEHKHIVGMPFTPDGRLSARDFVGLKLFQRFNREYPREMQARGWDIDEAIAYDPEATKDMTPEQKAQYKAEHKAKKGKHGLTSQAYMQQQEKQKQARLDQLDADIAGKEAHIAKLDEKEQKAEELSRGPLIGRAARKAEARAKDAEERQKAAEDAIEAARVEKQALDDQIREQRAALQSIQQAQKEAEEQRKASEDARKREEAERKRLRADMAAMGHMIQDKIDAAEKAKVYFEQMQTAPVTPTLKAMGDYMAKVKLKSGRTLYEDVAKQCGAWHQKVAKRHTDSLDDIIAEAERKAAEQGQQGRSHDYDMGR